MEKGFFHPDRGYWQTISNPSEKTLETYPEGTVEVPLMPGPHHQWDGSKWVPTDPPQPPVPQVVSRFQARAALHIAGFLVQVEAAVADADPLAQMAWADAQEFRRNSPTIAALAATVGLSEEQIDDLFRQAAQIVA